MKVTKTTDESLRRHACRDSQNLGVLGNSTMMFGFVHEVNGAGCAEFPEFIATEHELVQLLKYWAKVKLDVEYFYFLYTQTGSSEYRRRAFAERRIGRISALLGTETAQKAVEEAEKEFSKDLRPRDWAIFKNGTQAEWETFQDEVQREIEASFEERRAALAELSSQAVDSADPDAEAAKVN